MQKKVFDSLVNEFFGKQLGEMASFLFEKKNVNEFLIAKKLKLTPNQARNILYKFSHLGIVYFTRKKNKRKGWYTYFWTLNIDKIMEYMKRGMEQELSEIENRLKVRESQRFYICPICKTEVNEENALLHNFICPECGSVYELSSAEKIVNEIKSRMRNINNKLSMINVELQELGKKKQLAREREMKRAKKKAAVKRVKKMRAKKAELKKIAKKKARAEGKKKPKKKDEKKTKKVKKVKKSSKKKAKKKKR